MSVDTAFRNRRSWETTRIVFGHFYSNERTKEMFYLTTHSTHFIYGYVGYLASDIIMVKDQGRKEGNVLFNDALNTFYLRLYGVRHMGSEM